MLNNDNIQSVLMKSRRKVSIKKEQSQDQINEFEIFLESEDEPDSKAASDDASDHDSNISKKSEVDNWGSKADLEKLLKTQRRNNGQNSEEESSLGIQQNSRKGRKIRNRIPITSSIIKQYRTKAIQKSKIFSDLKDQQKVLYKQMTEKINLRLKQKRNKTFDQNDQSSVQSFQDVLPTATFIWCFYKKSKRSCKLCCKFCQRFYYIHRVSSSKLTAHIEKYHHGLLQVQEVFQQNRKIEQSKNKRKVRKKSIYLSLKQKQGESKKESLDIQYYEIEQSSLLKNPRRSAAWKHFLFNDVVREAKCKYCPATYNLRQGSTSGMLKHMVGEHPEYNSTQDLDKISDEKAIIPSQFRKKRRYKKRKTKIQKEKERINLLLQRYKNKFQKMRQTNGQGIKKEEQLQQFSQSQAYDDQKKCNKYGSNMHKNIQQGYQQSQYTRNFAVGEQIQLFIFTLPLYYENHTIQKSLKERFKDEYIRRLISRLQRHHWRYKKTEIQIVSSLAKNQHVQLSYNLIESDSSVKVLSSTQKGRKIISSIMIKTKNFEKNQYCQNDNLCIWEMNPNSSRSFKSILLLTGQNKSASLIVFEIVLMLDSSIQAYQQILFKYFSKTNSSPIGVMICGSPNLQCAYSLIRQTLKSPMCIYFNPAILKFTLASTICQLLSSWMTKMCEELTIQNYPFLGFALTGQYFLTAQYLLQIKRDNFDFSQFLFKIFQYQENLKEQIQSTENLFQQKCLFHFRSQNLKNQQKIFDKVKTENPQFQSLRQKLDPKILSKIVLSYFYGVKNHVVVSRNDKTVVVGRAKGQNQKKVVLNSLSGYWQCSCPTMKVLGIPCPHQMLVLQKTKNSIQKYIKQRWFIKFDNPEEETKLNTSKKKLGSKIAEMENIEEMKVYSKFGDLSANKDQLCDEEFFRLLLS